MWGWSILITGLGQLVQRRWKVAIAHFAAAVVVAIIFFPLAIAVWVYSIIEAHSWEKGDGGAVIGGHEFNDPTPRTAHGKPTSRNIQDH